TTWTAKIGAKDSSRALYNGWDLPDGEYFIDVEAADVEGVVTARQSVIIDNTPPVFILDNITSLGNAEDANVSVFGQKINLSGKIKDDTSVSKVFLDVYDENKQFIGSTSLDYKISNDGIPIAQYKINGFENEEQKVLAKNFNMIYGLADGDVLPADSPAVKTRYLSIRLSDIARIYNNPVFEQNKDVTGEGEGNKTERIYLNTPEFGIENINIDDLAEFEKHLTDENTEMQSKINSIKDSSVLETISGAAVDLSKTSKIKVNPEINPKWYVGNYDLLTNGNKKDFSAAYLTDDGAPLSVQLKAGNDNVKFRPSDVRIVMVRLEETQAGDENYSKMTLTDEVCRTAPRNPNNKDLIVCLDYKEGSSDTTLSLPYTIYLKKDELETPNRYRIMVFGKDVNGVDFCEDNKSWYGIKAAKAASAPEIKFITEDGSWIGLGNSEFKFEFDVKTDGEELATDYPKVKILVQDNKGAEITNPADSDFIWVNENGSTHNFTKGVNTVWLKNKTAGQKLPMPSEGQNYKYQVVIEAKDINGGSAQKTFKINVDRKLPTVKVNNATPYIYETNKEKLNGIVTIPVEFSDDQGIYKAYYKAQWESDFTEIVLTENEGSINLDTVGKVADDTEISVFIKAVDIYGNEKIEEKKYTVDQETDRPKLQFANLVNGNISSGTAYTFKDNSFGLTSGNKISGSVSDDDGNVDIELKITGVAFDNSAKIIRDWVKIKTDVSGAFDFNLSDVFDEEKLISKDGKYKLEFKVTDKVPGTPLPTKTYTSSAYPVMVDGSAPIFDDTSIVVKVNGTAITKDNSNYYISAGNSAAVSFKLTEGNLETVKVNGTETGITKSLVSGSTTDWNISYTWTPAAGETSGKKDLVFTAKDSSGNEKSKTIALFYDKDLPEIKSARLNPVIESFKTSNGTTQTNVVNGKVTLTGEVSDNDKISKVEISVKDKNNKEVKETFTTDSFTKEINTTELADGTLTVTVKATD
ncbi:MAG: Ig-like domain-containing protein, partial [Treponema sp.]|nr:Ig-like domain-containing protein [Treponema sp.]